MSSKVLVVEDDPDVCELVCQILEMHDMPTQSAMAGKEGLSLAKSWHPDAMVLDLMLPDMDGFEVCKEVKKEPAPIGVIVLTAMHDNSARERAFEAGADRFLTKPFVPQEVIEGLQSVTAEYRNSQPGLRVNVDVSFGPDALHQQRLQHYLSNLFHTTPLAAEEINLLGGALLGIAQSLFQWQQEESQQVHMACQVYRDRLEHTVRLGKENICRARSGRELFDQLFDHSVRAFPSTITENLRHSLRFADDRPELVLTRTFA